jgi:hypothetical protein
LTGYELRAVRRYPYLVVGQLPTGLVLYRRLRQPSVEKN